MKTTFFKLFVFIAAIITLNGCSEEKTGIYKNDQIDPAKREQLHALDVETFKYLIANDVKSLQNIAFKALIKNVNTIRQTELIYFQLLTNEFAIYDEYYVVAKLPGEETIVNNTRGVNSYKLKVKLTDSVRELYIVCYVPKNGDNKNMITFSFGKFDYGWKLFQMELGPFMINSKTAPELYLLARDKMSHKYFADAASIIEMAKTSLQPTGMMTYKDDGQINRYYVETTAMAQKVTKFPLVATQIPTQPQIFRIANEKTPNGTFPVIYYKSTISIKDTAAVNKENKDLQKMIGGMIPGIDKDKKYLLYDVFNQIPTNQTMVDKYRITQAIDK